MRGLSGAKYPVASSGARLLSQFPPSNGCCGRNDYRPSTSRNLARTGRRLHCFYSILMPEIHRRRFTGEKDLPEAPFLERRSRNQARTRRLCALSGPAGSREGHKDSTEGLAKAKTHSFDDSRGRPTPKRGPRVSERESLGDSVFAFASTKMSRVDERRALFDLAIGRISGDLRTCCHRGLCLRIARDCLLFRCDAGIGGRSKEGRRCPLLIHSLKPEEVLIV